MVIEINDDYLRMLTGYAPGEPLAMCIKNYLYEKPNSQYRRQILGDFMVKQLEAALMK